MAQFKADSNYKPSSDDDATCAWYDSDGSLDAADHTPRDPCRRRRAWYNEHADVLMELYKVFVANGESVFGRAFFQLGDSSRFIDFCYENTHFADADLLKTKIAQQHVSALGLSARSEHRLPQIMTPQQITFQ